MSMNYDYNPESYQYNTQGVDPMWDYADGYIGVDSSPVNAQQFGGFGMPFFGGPFFGGPFFGRPFFGRPFFGGPFFGPFPFRRFGRPFFFR